MEKLYVPNWMALSKETKDHLIKVFGLVKTGNSEIRDQEVVTDGFTNNDLEGITLSKMAEYTGSPASESFHRLWEVTLSKVKYELHPPIMDISLKAEIVPEVKTKFCDFCEAVGPIKHKANCTKP